MMFIELSPLVQSINDILFPVELFFVIFPILWAMFMPSSSEVKPQGMHFQAVNTVKELPCHVEEYLTVGLTEVVDNVNLDAEEISESKKGVFSSDENNCEVEAESTSSVVQTEPMTMPVGAEQAKQLSLVDVDFEKKQLKSLHIRKLVKYCQHRELKGYATIRNSSGIDGLVEFLIERNVRYADVNRFVEMSA
jgi:hypothetical protein